MNNCFGRPCKHGQVTFLRILCVKYGALQMDYILKFCSHAFEYAEFSKQRGSEEKEAKF